MSVTLTDTVCLHPEVEEKLKKWLKLRPTPAFLCVGPPGIGKTTLVHRVCQLEGYWARELNASHTRTGSAFRDIILPLLENPGITAWASPKSPNGHIVVLDEMDGLSQGERGGLQELLKYLRDNKKGNIRVPLILICNEINGRKMQQILRLCEVVSVGRPTNDILCEWLGRNLKQNENLQKIYLENNDWLKQSGTSYLQSRRAKFGNEPINIREAEKKPEKVSSLFKNIISSESGNRIEMSSLDLMTDSVSSSVPVVIINNNNQSDTVIVNVENEEPDIFHILSRSVFS
jgi:DNA polymerase III delta prime subunit